MADTQDFNSLGAPVFRRPSITHAEFCTHWLQTHGPIATLCFLQPGNIVEYTQIHLPDAQDRSGSAEAKEKLLPFDGVGLLTTKRVPDAQGAQNQGIDEYYKNVVLPDERRFLHEESGLTPVKKSPPIVEILPMGASEWKQLALEVGGVRHTLIRDGKSTIALPEEVSEEFKRWRKE